MPHLRELVKLYEKKPFAIIGVNTNDDPETYEKGLDKYDVTWISAYQGKKSEISNLYRVRGYPTYYLLDPTGKIVAKGHSSKALDAPLARLMRELEKEGD